MKDYTVVFLTCTRKESRNVNQCYQRNIESVAETNEATCFTRCVAIQASCHNLRLVGYDTDRLSVETSETYDDILSVIRMNL